MPRATWLTLSKMPLYTRRSSTSSCTHREDTQIVAWGMNVKTKVTAQLTADREAHPKLLHSPVWCLWVVPQFDHGHRHRLIKDDVHAVHLCGNNHYTNVLEYSLLSALAEWPFILSLSKSSPVQGAPGLTTYVFHRGCRWLHLLIYPESSHHRSHCPVCSHCLEKQRCLVDITLRNRHKFTPSNSPSTAIYHLYAPSL